MPIAHWEKDENAAILYMDNGENRHNMEFAATMNNLIDEILEDKSIGSIVITSSDEKNFSQGIDVAWMGDKIHKNEPQAIKDFLYRINDVFKKLMISPVATVAAINGHAYGNGAILACACDFRFMKSDRGFFCFPEVNIGIMFFPGMNALTKKVISMPKFLEMQFTGNRYTALELEKYDIIRKACADRNELMKESIAFAKTFQKKRGIFGEMKRRMYKDIIDIMEKVDPAVSIEPLDVMRAD